MGGYDGLHVEIHKLCKADDDDDDDDEDSDSDGEAVPGTLDEAPAVGAVVKILHEDEEWLLDWIDEKQYVCMSVCGLFCLFDPANRVVLLLLLFILL